MVQVWEPRTARSPSLGTTVPKTNTIRSPMSDLKLPLPDFEQPPVVEVAISLQFMPLESIRSSHFGLLWNVFRKQGFSRTEDHGELAPAFEDLSATRPVTVGVRLQTFDDAPPLPRVWFLNQDKNELLQIQRDRLIVNWRQGINAEPYPRYVAIIERFRAAVKLFADFANLEQVGEIVPTQCEITYVNHLQAGLGWENHSEIDKVVTTWRNISSDGFLPLPEDVNFAARYRMVDKTGNAVGRLHVNFQPANRSADHRPIFIMNLTARGKPEPADMTGVFQLFDREHEWIVRGFASLTSTTMHRLWRRKNGN